MPTVVVVPVYVEINAGFERAIMTLESYLNRAGYAFHVGEPMDVKLEQLKVGIKVQGG